MSNHLYLNLPKPTYRIVALGVAVLGNGIDQHELLFSVAESANINDEHERCAQMSAPVSCPVFECVGITDEHERRAKSWRDKSRQTGSTTLWSSCPRQQ